MHQICFILCFSLFEWAGRGVHYRIACGYEMENNATWWWVHLNIMLKFEIDICGLQCQEVLLVYILITYDFSENCYSNLQHVTVIIECDIFFLGLEYDLYETQLNWNCSKNILICFEWVYRLFAGMISCRPTKIVQSTMCWFVNIPAKLVSWSELIKLFDVN